MVVENLGRRHLALEHVLKHVRGTPDQPHVLVVRHREAPVHLALIEELVRLGETPVAPLAASLTFHSYSCITELVKQLLLELIRDVQDGVEWRHFLVRERRHEFILKAALELELLPLDDRGDVCDGEQLALALCQG